MEPFAWFSLVFTLSGVLHIAFADTVSLSCYTCQGAPSNEECNQHAVTCPSVFQACQTVVRPGSVDKRCRSLVDCWREAQAGCRGDTCSYCCDQDMCNQELPLTTHRLSTIDTRDPCDPNPCHNGGTCEEIDDRGLRTPRSAGEERPRRSHGPKRVRRQQLAELDGKTAHHSGSRHFDGRPRDDDFVCHCREGYHGQYCEEGGNPCSSNPCQHGGTCHHDDTTHWCDCPQGYEGHSCEIVITNPCNPSPCQHGGSCHHDGSSYLCECPPGYTGHFCEIIPSNPCDPNPCHNGGSCHHDGSASWCECHPGHHGTHCEIIGDPQPCGSYPCQHGGTCHNDGGSYWCECPSGYDGQFCEIIGGPNPCDARPCLHGGTCHPDGGSFWCDCPPGYSGYNCDTAADPCNPSPCVNGGSCELDSSDSSRIFKSFGSSTNDEDSQSISDLDILPGHIKGSRRDSEETGGFICRCPEGFYGRFCEDTDDPCEPNPCQNGGACHVGESDSSRLDFRFDSESADEYYFCECSDGYVGKYCEEVATPCGSTPCLFGGTCHTDGNSFWCECLEGYGGSNCEDAPHPCESNPCENGGTCEEDERSWGPGLISREDGDGLLPGIILPAPGSRRRDDRDFVCRCLDDYYGKHCQDTDNPCEPSPCQNGGTCELGDPGDASGATGRIGEWLDEREPNDRPWRSGNNEAAGQEDEVQAQGHWFLKKLISRIRDRSNSADAWYYCRCPEQYHGKYCEYPEGTTPCMSNPCHNGATCYHDNDEYWCFCTPEYEGDQCDDPRTPCDPNPCLYGGMCQQYDGGSFECQCQPGYSGTFCEYPPAPSGPCVSQPCQHGGTCHDHGESYDCECQPGYSGHWCEHEPQPPPNPNPGDGYNCEANNPCTPENIEDGEYYWPHDDPSKFVQCDNWGQCFVQECPAGLIWEQEIWECVRP